MVCILELSYIKPKSKTTVFNSLLSLIAIVIVLHVLSSAGMGQIVGTMLVVLFTALLILFMNRPNLVTRSKTFYVSWKITNYSNMEIS